MRFWSYGHCISRDILVHGPGVHGVFFLRCKHGQLDAVRLRIRFTFLTNLLHYPSLLPHQPSILVCTDFIDGCIITYHTSSQV